MPGVHAALGELYAEASDFEQAERHYASELAVSPGGPDLNTDYGRVLVQLGRSAEAIPYLRKAVAADPTPADAYWQLGKALFDEGQAVEAEAALRKVLALGASLQTTMSTHYQLGQILRHQGKREESAKHLAMFRKLRGQLLRAEQKAQ